MPASELGEMADEDRKSEGGESTSDIEIDDPPTLAEHVAPVSERGREDVVLVAISGPDAGRRFLVPPDGGLIGREDGVAMRLSDVNISRRHAAVSFDEKQRVIVSDLGSSNGVFVNGARVSRGELLDGYRVQLSSDTVLRVRFQDPCETRLQEDQAGAQTRDSLTGLPNRRELIDRIAQELSFARRHGVPLSVMLANVDELQKVIDTDGHRGSALLLSAIAELIREGSRYEDVVGRYADGEVLVVLRATTNAQTKSYARRMMEKVRARAFDVGDVAIRATISCGVGSYEVDGEDIDGAVPLIERAEAALTHAKQQGRDAGGSRPSSAS